MAINPLKEGSMKRKLLIAALIAPTLVGCAGRTYEPAGVSHPNGVVFYDRNGNLQEAQPESVSPESQDGWETAGAILGGAAAVAGVALGIVALTK